MKRAYWIIQLLLATIPGFPQDHRPGDVCRPQTKYDRVADKTTVQCTLLEWVAAPTNLSIQASTSFQGKEPNETAKFSLVLSASHGKATRKTPTLFQQATTLTLWLDDAPLEIPLKDYRKDYFEPIQRLGEWVNAEIGRADLQKLLGAQRLVGQCGSVEVRFSAAELAALKAFIARQIFATQTR